MRPLGSGTCRVRSVVERDALLVGRAHDDVDEVDVVADLGDGAARYHRVEHARQRLRAQPQQARLVLVDADAHLPGRLDPVEIDVHGLRIVGDDLGELEGDLAHLRRVRTADAILHRPSDRRSELQRVDAADDARKIVGQRLSRA